MSAELEKIVDDVKARLELYKQKADNDDKRAANIKEEVEKLIAAGEAKEKALKEEKKKDAAASEAKEKALRDEMKKEAEELRKKAESDLEKFRAEEKADNEKRQGLERADKEKKEKLVREKEKLAQEKNEKLEKWMDEFEKSTKAKFEVLNSKAPRFAGANFGGQYLDAGPWNVTATVSDLATMSAQDWSTVVRMNKVLYGYVVRDDGDGTKLVKARSPAFAVKPGRAQPIAIAQPATEVAQVEGPTPKDAKAKLKEPAVNSVPDPLPDVPEFEISDASSVSISEVKNSLQKSLSESGFTESAINSAIGYGTFSVSAGICAGLKTRDEASSTDVTQTDSKEFHSSYNFPRVSLFLDELSLDLSDDCKKALASITDKSTLQDLKNFSGRFGHVFATSIKLGGRLKSAKYADASFGSNDTEKKEAIRVAMGAQFSTPAVTVNASRTSESQQVVTRTNQKEFQSSSLTWTASGGDTLLCANPPAWASSVSSHKNWRVIEQDIVLPLHELLDRFEGYKNTTKMFKGIAGPGKVPHPILTKPNPGMKWSGKITLSVNDDLLVSGYVDIEKESTEKSDTEKAREAPADLNELYLTYPRFKKVDGATMQILNADPKEGTFGTSLTTMYFDIPILLLHGTGDLRIRGSRCNAVWADDTTFKPMAQLPDSQFLRYSTFSLRRPGLKNDGTDAWNPDAMQQLRNGDMCNVYCHSLGNGRYVSLDKAPNVASRLLVHKTKRVLQFAKDLEAEKSLTASGYEIANVVVQFL